MKTSLQMRHFSSLSCDTAALLSSGPFASPLLEPGAQPELRPVPSGGTPGPRC